MDDDDDDDDEVSFTGYTRRKHDEEDDDEVFLASTAPSFDLGEGDGSDTERRAIPVRGLMDDYGDEGAVDAMEEESDGADGRTSYEMLLEHIAAKEIAYGAIDGSSGSWFTCGDRHGDARACAGDTARAMLL